MNEQRSRQRPGTPGLFSRLAGHYDRFNRLTSFGIDGWWRHRALRRIPRESRVLDLGCGGGQLAPGLAKRGAFCLGVDPSHGMLMEGVRSGRPFLPVRAGGEALPFRDGTWDVVVSAFVMRNLLGLESTLRECRRVLKPGGKLVVLDFFPPRSRLLRFFYRLYLGRLIPWVYGRLNGRGGDAAWLYDSIAGFHTPAAFMDIAAECGFENIRMRPLVFRIAWLLEARRGRV